MDTVFQYLHSLDTLAWTIIVLATLLMCMNFIIHILFYRPLEKVKETSNTPSEECIGVSIIIVAHNDEENLRKHLPCILNQDYPLFEVIVVNNNSSDNTASLIKYLQQSYPHLHSTFLPDSADRKQNKKLLAITLGIKAAQYPLALITTAQTIPTDSKWIKRMSEQMHPNTDIVTGFWSINTPKKASRFFAASHAVSTLAPITRHYPILIPICNSLFRKELLFQNNQFSKLLYRSNAEYLLLQDVTHRHRVSIAQHPQASIQIDTEGSHNYAHWLALIKSERRVLKSLSSSGKFLLQVYRQTPLLLMLLSIVSTALFCFFKGSLSVPIICTIWWIICSINNTHTIQAIIRNYSVKVPFYTSFMFTTFPFMASIIAHCKIRTVGN